MLIIRRYPDIIHLGNYKPVLIGLLFYFGVFSSLLVTLILPWLNSTSQVLHILCHISFFYEWSILLSAMLCFIYVTGKIFFFTFNSNTNACMYTYKLIFMCVCACVRERETSILINLVYLIVLHLFPAYNE